MHTLCRIVFVERCQQRKLTKSSDIILPEAAAEVIGRQGGVQDVLAALRAFPNNSEIASNCCGALWSLAVNGEFAKPREGWGQCRQPGTYTGLLKQYPEAI